MPIFGNFLLFRTFFFQISILHIGGQRNPTNKKSVAFSVDPHSAETNNFSPANSEIRPAWLNTIFVMGEWDTNFKNIKLNNNNASKIFYMTRMLQTVAKGYP